jgi:hypothetical protein
LDTAETGHREALRKSRDMNWSENLVPLEMARQSHAGWRAHVMTATELQRMKFPPIKYVVPGYIPEGVTLLAGKPKTGKSWMALDSALAVACGGIAFGSITCAEGDVLYCALEDNNRRLQRRMNMLLPGELEWPARLTLARSWRRLDAGGLDDIHEWAADIAEPRLVILDTFACVRPLRTAKDNGYDSDYDAVSPLQVMAGEMGLGVVVVHHRRKLESDDPLDSVSGTTGLTGAADTVLVLNRDSQGVTLYGRGRDIDDIETAVEFDKTTGRWSILGPASEVRRSDERTRVIEALGRGAMKVADLVAATGTSRNNLDQLLFKMAGKGEIVRPKRGVVTLP